MAIAQCQPIDDDPRSCPREYRAPIEQQWMRASKESPGAVENKLTSTARSTRQRYKRCIGAACLLSSRFVSNILQVSLAGFIFCAVVSIRFTKGKTETLHLVKRSNCRSLWVSTINHPKFFLTAVSLVEKPKLFTNQTQ